MGSSTARGPQISLSFPAMRCCPTGGHRRGLQRGSMRRSICSAREPPRKSRLGDARREPSATAPASGELHLMCGSGAMAGRSGRRSSLVPARFRSLASVADTLENLGTLDLFSTDLSAGMLDNRFIAMKDPSSTIAGPIDNRGKLVLQGTTNLAQSLVNRPGAIMRVEGTPLVPAIFNIP